LLKPLLVRLPQFPLALGRQRIAFAIRELDLLQRYGLGGFGAFGRRLGRRGLSRYGGSPDFLRLQCRRGRPRKQPGGKSNSSGPHPIDPEPARRCLCIGFTPGSRRSPRVLASIEGSGGCDPNSTEPFAALPAKPIYNVKLDGFGLKLKRMMLSPKPTVWSSAHLPNLSDRWRLVQPFPVRLNPKTK
jgi:hypothetical protein